ncbi:ABC transporter substrate-binding protein [Alkalicoccobacillus murimartini]|uniref:Multiple sugar transport system substrate-binding protein n=1 Tax=Alkalicoccobacillus murimartini TaxID=171685 RepID=A0ABT9YJD5_9BACI|nr:sugar ABC transporter substrate-binding protein [Alkalicoccobacillus murimartini]MDQ0207600.1 multiple sugar transport system substrate-binding protein [Alkalicoccobacillus murimartini]
MRKGIRFVLAISLLSALGACSSSSSGDDKAVQLTFSAWGNPEEMKVYERAVDSFNEQHDDIHVEFNGIGGDYFQTLSTRLQGGQAPDLFYLSAGDVSTLIQNETIAPISDFLESDESYVKLEEFTTGDIWGPAIQDDVVYALPVDTNPYLFYYNKTLLDEVGATSPQEYFDRGEWNWDAVEEITDLLRDAGKYGFVQENSHESILNWIWTNGGLFADDDSIVADNDPKTLEAYEFITRMVRDDNFVFAGTLPEGQGTEAMFMSNQVGLVGAGRWLTPMFLDTDLDFDYIPWPSNTENPIETAGVGMGYLAVNANSDHPEEAKLFQSYYTSKEGQEIRLTAQGNAIPSVEGIDDVVLDQQEPEHIQYLVDAREVGRVAKYENTAPGLATELSDIYELMFLGDLSAQEALERAANISREMLGE